jgi:hypothetical protein
MRLMLDARAMRRPPPLVVAAVVVLLGFAGAFAAVVVLPGWLVDDTRFVGAATNPATEEKRLKARHDVRTVGVQLVGALALIVGGAFTWRTVWLTREGQITDRLAKAIEQLGADRQEVRVGAIHALGRVARDSRVDHPEVMALLAEHLRARHPSPKDDTPSPGVPPEVGAVAMVLRARRVRWDPAEPRLNFSAIDFRSAALQKVDLRRADLRKCHFRGAYLSDANLTGARLQEARLTSASLQRATLKRAQLSNAKLGRAHVTAACLRGADLDDVFWDRTDLRDADLRMTLKAPTSEVTFKKLVLFNDKTKWPWDERWWARVVRPLLPLARSAQGRWHQLRQNRNPA